MQNTIQTLQNQVQELEALLAAIPPEEEVVGEEIHGEDMVADGEWDMEGNPDEVVEWEEGWPEDEWIEPESVVIDISSEAPSLVADSNLTGP